MDWLSKKSWNQEDAHFRHESFQFNAGSKQIDIDIVKIQNDYK